MRPSTLLLGLSALFTLTTAQEAQPPPSAAAPQEPQAPLLPTSKSFRISIWTRPLTPHPHLSNHEKYAKITYTIPSNNSTVTSYDIPSFLDPLPGSDPSSGETVLAGDDVVKLGFYSGRVGDMDTWHGIITTASAFSKDRSKTLKLFLDDTGKVWSLGFTSVPKTLDVSATAIKKKAKKAGKGKAVDKTEEQERDALNVEIIPLNKGQGPALNKPVVVKEGAVEEGEPEKSFLQKYWWAIALFLVLQIFMGGGDK